MTSIKDLKLREMKLLHDQIPEFFNGPIYSDKQWRINKFSASIYFGLDIGPVRSQHLKKFSNSIDAIDLSVSCRT